MKNLVTNEFVGGIFMDWVRNNFDVIQQHATFFPLFEKACKKENVTLTPLFPSDDKYGIIMGILSKNHKTVTYCEGITDDANYLCEDTCHKLYGFNALSDIGFPYIYDENLGSTIMYMFEDYDKKTFEERTWLDKFSAYLAPKIMERLVKMTKEFMGAEGDRIDDYTIKCIWGEESNQSLHEWIASFQGLILYSDPEDYICDYLDMNVLHPAIGAVEGDMELSDTKYCELHDYVSSGSWDYIIKVMNGDEGLIKDTRKDLGLYKPEKVNIAGYTWDKIDESPLDETDHCNDKVWWHCGNFTEGELWSDNNAGRFCLLCPNGDILLRYF